MLALPPFAVEIVPVPQDHPIRIDLFPDRCQVLPDLEREGPKDISKDA